LSRWPIARLGDVLAQRQDIVAVDPTAEYPMAGVYSFGKGVFFRGVQLGQETSYKEFYRLHAGDLVLSRVKGWEGAIGVVPKNLDGHHVSKEFPAFVPRDGRVCLPYLAWFFHSKAGLRLLGKAARGIGARRERVKEKQFLEIEVPLPPIEEQQRISVLIGAVDANLSAIRAHRLRIAKEARALMQSVFARVTRCAPRHPLAEVAPLERRAVEITPEGEYLELGVRSFGHGAFHKDRLYGSDLTWQKLFLVRTGDIVISNIKAWEGAIAVAGPEDDGRVGSHRYLTLAPVKGRAAAEFICYYLLTAEGLTAIGKASPGSADRNRTLGQKALQSIEVPVPAFTRQVEFGRLHAQVRSALRTHSDSDPELDALRAATINRSFLAQ